MTFVHYGTVLIKRWKLILLCLILLGVGTFVGSKFQTPLYQSSAIVQVAIRSVNSQSDYTSLLASDQLVQTESQLAISNPVLSAVASHHKGYTFDQLTKQVTSTVKLNTQLFEIDVLDPNPGNAAMIANDVANTLINQQKLILTQDNDSSQQKIQDELDTTQKSIDEITNQIISLQNQGKTAQAATLNSKLNGLQDHYNQWQTTLAQLALSEAQNGDFLRLSQPAQPGNAPVRPQILLNTAIGLGAGLFLGMMLAVLFEQLDTRIRNSEALAQMLNWSLLATVWNEGSSKKNKNVEVVNPSGDSVNIESYRILRTNIGFSLIDKSLRSIVVTSSIPNEGKSVVASNLAIIMAKAGKNTLLIDADLRRPTLHQKFDIAGDKMGLSNAVLAFSQLHPVAVSGHHPVAVSGHSKRLVPLTPGVNLDDYCHQVGIPNLRVMPSGPLPPNPPELLDSKAMERLMKAFENYKAEVVIFDTPPILGISDTSILASKVDGVIAVFDIVRARKKHVAQLKMQLAQAGANVLGYVVNKQRRSRDDTSYSYYYYYRTIEGKSSSRNGKVPASSNS